MAAFALLRLRSICALDTAISAFRRITARSLGKASRWALAVCRVSRAA